MSEKKEDVQKCKGPLDEKCLECPEVNECDLHLYHRMPHWILTYLVDPENDVKPVLQNIFLYLCSIAKLEPKYSDFATCRPSNKEIAKVAGIVKKDGIPNTDNLSRYLKALEEHKLIKRIEQRLKNPDGEFVTFRTITIPHMIKHDELLKLHYLELEKKKKNKKKVGK